MALLSPQPRLCFYGSPGIYPSLAADLLLGGTRRGDAVGGLEVELARRLGAEHAIALPQARVGIHLALKSLLGARRDVVMSPYTIHDVVNVVIAAGGRPVFADIERETANIDAAQVEKLVDDRTGAVLVTHLHGLACDVERIRAVCDRAGVPLLEDCAQAFGCRVRGRSVGTFGRAGIFSFGMAKNVNAFYGGLLLTDDARLAAAVRSEIGAWPVESRSVLLRRALFCLFGDLLTAPLLFQALTFRVWRYGQLRGIEAITKRVRGEDEPTFRGELPERYRRRMTPAQARLVSRALGRVESETRVRVESARLYDRALSGLPEVLLPPFRDDGSHIYLSYPIQVPDRDDLRDFLMRSGRDVTIQHMGNNADYACFRDYARECPNARATARSVLLLPCYPRYGQREVERNASVVQRYFSA
jgi:dTDP-4-amino-4,6-dideoxygalactose transaminase